MSIKTPTLHILDTPPHVQKSMWEHEVDYASLERKVFNVSRQPKLNRGDLVEWSPTGKRGLWRITDVSAWRDAADMDSASFEEAFGATTSAMANEMSEEIDDQILEEMGVKVIRREVGRGKVRLEWFSGWGGYANDRAPVQVKIEEIRRLTEMEVVALAASDA